MNKKIVRKILVLGCCLSVVAFAAARAFFTDTEKTEGNVLSAGSLNLQVSYQTSYNGRASTGWDFSDLTNQKYLDLNGLYPGDYGTGLIKLKPLGTDAYACLTNGNMTDSENTRIDPEIDEDDLTDDVGEMKDFVHFYAWNDDGDGAWENGETELYSNVATGAETVLDDKTYGLNTPLTTPAAITADTIRSVAFYWCFGNLTVDETNNTFDCAGTDGANAAQTDSLTADMSLKIEQAENNSTFACN